MDWVAWGDRTHPRWLSLFGQCGLSAAFWLSWRPLTDVSPSEREEKLSNCALGALSVLLLWLVQLNRLSLFLGLKPCLRRSSVLTCVLHSHTAAVGCPDPPATAMGYFNGQFGVVGLDRRCLVEVLIFQWEMFTSTTQSTLFLQE